MQKLTALHVQNVLWFLPYPFDRPRVGLFFFYSTDRVIPEKPDSQPACRGSIFLGRLGGANGNEKR